MPKDAKELSLSPTQRSRQARRQQLRNKRKEPRRPRRGPWLVVSGILAVTVAVIGLFIYLSVHSSQSSHTSTSGSYPMTPADPTVIKEVTGVDPSILAAIGTGSGQVQTPPTKISGSPPLLTGPNGKPEVFYYGAEYCPYCAAERWAMIVALSRFGTFNHLSQTSSSSTDAYPNTPTFSFSQSTYTSQYLDFVSVEGQSYQGVTLQQPTADQQQLMTTYDKGGGIPFVDIANRYWLSGASYDPQVLSNQDWQSIASSLFNAQSPIAQSILGTANYLTAAICQTTNQQPTSVCQAAPIPTVERTLG